MLRDLAGRHPARVHRDDLVVEAREAALVLRHDLRLEEPSRSRGSSTSTGPWSVINVFGDKPFRRFGCALGRLTRQLVAKMLGQLSRRRTLNHTLGQLLQQPIRARDRLRALTTGEQLIDQLVRNLLRGHDPPLRIMHTQNPGRSRREALTQLRAVIVTAPELLRQALCRMPEGKLLDRCSRLRRTSSAAPTSLRHGSCCAASPAGSGRPPSKLTSSSRRSSATYRPSRRRCSTSPGRPDRRRPTNRRLVTPRPTALRSLLRPPRRRRTRPRLKRPNHEAPPQPRRRPPTQPRPPHHRPPPPPTRPGNPRLHRPPHRRRQEPPRRHPATQALPRPPPLPAPPTTGTADRLTNHRSISHERWPTERFGQRIAATPSWLCSPRAVRDRVELGAVLQLIGRGRGGVPSYRAASAQSSRRQIV